MSPILTRPVREQFEHDRIIRLLQARYRRKFEVAINPGPEQNTSVGIGEQTVFPDVVLFSQDHAHKLQGTIEVETGESVNTLEAMSQWALFSRLRVPFVLYLPPSALDTARRLCVAHNIPVAEIWTYHTALDQVRFTMVQRLTAAPAPAAPKPRPVPEDAAKPAGKKPIAAAKAPAAKTATPAKPTKTAAATPAKPAKAAAAKPAAKAAKKAKPVKAAAAKAPVRAAAKAAKASTARKTARPAKKRR